MAQHIGSGRDLLRIGVFYDGTYFAHVSNYYLFEHDRKARISIGGLHEFIRETIAQEEGVDKRFCQIVDSHYFRGRLSAKLALAHASDLLYRERQFDDVLIREGVTMHLLPISADTHGDISEKGIDVWFALEAFELAVHKRFDVIVMLTGDGDFVPLVRKLNTLGTRVMLLAWDFEFQKDGRLHGTRTSQVLINEVTYPVMMSAEIDSRGRKNDPAIARLFVQRAKDVLPSAAGPQESPAAATAVPFDEADTRFGAIISVLADKGYGFIRPDGGGDGVFFHYKSLLDCELAQLAPGSAVAFNIVATERGPQAVAVRLRTGE